jgi:5-methylcytosine-specific restriction enzyme A
MSEISKFRPASRQRIMDLLQVVGVDVSDWKNFKGGIKRAASNPRYCYSWSFVQPEKVVVLNLWYDDLKTSNGRIMQELDLRKDARQYADMGKPEWHRRAIQMDQAIQSALREKLPIRVVICDGKMNRSPKEKKASQVQKRMLDTETWTVTRYDWKTGKCEVTRGSTTVTATTESEALPFIPEEIDDIDLEEGGREQIVINAYERNAKARSICLSRWGSTCAVCGFNFEDEYGELFRGLIHVHHLTPVSARIQRYSLNPARDLRPVCPNCHAALHHKKNPPYTIDEMKAILQKLPRKNRNN